MKIRTLENLSDSLAAEISWRKKELAVLRSLIRSSEASPSKLVAMIRSGVTVLYAHWEGFVKAAAASYLEFVSNRKLKYRDLKVSFRAIAARSLLSAATDSSRIEKMISVTEFLLNQQDETSQIPFKGVLPTRSNLSSKALRDITSLLSLDYTPYATKEKLIDNTLLYFRNNIAHGRDLYPAYDQFEELFSTIIDLMDLFKNQIENSAFTHSYKRALSPSRLEL